MKQYNKPEIMVEEDIMTDVILTSISIEDIHDIAVGPFDNV